MKKRTAINLIIAAFALLLIATGCVKQPADPNPHCWKCTLRNYQVKPETNTVYNLCDKTEAEIRQYERDSTTTYREKQMFCAYRSK